MTTNTDFAKYLSKFLSGYLPYERNMSPNTVTSYKDTFVLFINYMKDIKRIQVERLTLKDITRQIVIDFLSWIVTERGCSVSTRNSRLSAIHSFILYLQYEDIKNLEEWQKILSIKPIRAETKKLTYLSTEGMRILLAQPGTDTHSGRRDLTILALMYDTAARVQEIIDLTPESVRIENAPYTIRLVGKGRKSRIVPLMQEQVDILRPYMEENGLLELGRNKHPLFSMAVWKNSRDPVWRIFLASMYMRLICLNQS